MKHLYALLLASAFAGLAQAQLSGTYTVGGAQPDYATITAAVNALNAQGASGNVIFDIRPGTYTGQYSLGEISGTPGSIQFRNSSNGSQLVNLEYDANGSLDNHIFKLDGTDDVLFEKLNFLPLDFNYARAIHFINGLIEGLIIEQCVFRGSTNPSGSAYLRSHPCTLRPVSTSIPNNNPQDVLILDNSFFDGNTAVEIDAYGFNGARCDGLIISGNEFRQQIGTGIKFQPLFGFHQRQRLHHHRGRTGTWASAPPSSTVAARSGATTYKRLCHQWVHRYRGGQHTEHHRQHDQ
jgi:hypothetical protein